MPATASSTRSGEAPLALDRPTPEDSLPDVCPNCGADRLGDWCQQCGQPYLDGRLTFRRLWREFAERFLKLERGLLGTFRQLCLRPGGVARDYVEGRRKRYVNPLSYLFLGAAVTLLILPLATQIRADGGTFGYSADELQQMTEFGLLMRGQNLETRSPEEQAAFREVMEQVMPLYLDSLSETFQRLNSIFAFLYALLLAGLLKLFMSGAGRTFTYAETTVLALFATGHYYLLTPVLTLALLPTLGAWAYTAAAFVLFAVIVVWSVAGFYGRSIGRLALGFLAFTVSYAGYMIVVMATAAPLAMYGVRDEVRAIVEAAKVASGS